MARNPQQAASASPDLRRRREVLEWLGRGAVLALSARLAASCDDSASSEPGVFLPDAGPPPPEDAADASVGNCGLSFKPGDGTDPIYTGFYENTVDPQDLQAILAGWTLTVDGLADASRTFTFADLLALPRQDQVTDFHCVTGWSVYDVGWNGILLGTLLDAVQPSASATHLTVHCVNGKYSESIPLAVAREPRTLLAYGVRCNTLPVVHGFPLRLIVPRLFGYKNAKYVQRLELTDHPVAGFWEQRGYSYDGEVQPARLRPGKY